MTAAASSRCAGVSDLRVVEDLDGEIGREDDRRGGHRAGDRTAARLVDAADRCSPRPLLDASSLTTPTQWVLTTLAIVAKLQLGAEVFLKTLEIFGFKSFADKVQIEFTDGVAALLGPNGCGKSNVVDAMKWVLGEQSSKSLRAENMVDVIFAGSRDPQAARCRGGDASWCPTRTRCFPWTFPRCPSSAACTAPGRASTSSTTTP